MVDFGTWGSLSCRRLGRSFNLKLSPSLERRFAGVLLCVPSVRSSTDGGAATPRFARCSSASPDSDMIPRCLTDAILRQIRLKSGCRVLPLKESVRRLGKWALSKKATQA